MVKTHPLFRTFFVVVAIVVGLPGTIRAAQTPCGGTLDPAPSITLSWDAVPSARSYTVEITTNAGFTSGIQLIGVAGLSNQTQATGLQYSTTYYWRLRSNSQESWLTPNYTYGSICSFGTSAAPTQAPQSAPLQIAPANNWISQSSNTTLRWSPYSGATNYEVQLSTSPTMASPLAQQTTSLLWTPPIAITQGTTYYWRVRAFNASGWGSWTNSPIWRFDTESVLTQIDFKAFLQGPMSTNPLDPNVMNDGLRSAGLIPNFSPYFFSPTLFEYRSSPDYPALAPIAPLLANYENGRYVDASELALTGTTAIVDWVVVEARHGSTNMPLRCWLMLLRRDGSMVFSLQGGGGTLNESMPMKNVKFAIRHRNHLGVMTANAVNAVGTPLTIDFTSTSTALFGTNPTTLNVNSSKRVLWAGDCSANGTVLYTGSGNDRDLVLSAIGGVVPTNTVTGYRTTDLNMDGTVKYTGSGNDRDIILSVIGGVVPTNSRVQQLP